MADKAGDGPVEAHLQMGDTENRSVVSTSFCQYTQNLRKFEIFFYFYTNILYFSQNRHCLHQKVTFIFYFHFK